MVIWKFEIELMETQFLNMPIGATVLEVARQGSNICLWAMVNPKNKLEPRCFEVHGTGIEMPELKDGEKRVFLGSVHFAVYVWHIFENVSQ